MQALAPPVSPPMASHRALNLTTRWQGFTSSLLRTTVSWLKSIGAQKSVPNEGVIRTSALERALQDLHGDRLEKLLDLRQRLYLKDKRCTRASYQAHNMGRSLMRPARDDEYSAQWHDSVKRWKTVLLERKKARERAVRERRSKRNISGVRLES